jgi:hypothetical protein
MIVPTLYMIVRSLTLSKNRHKNVPIPQDLHMFRFMIMFILCFTMGNTSGGHPKNIRLELLYGLDFGPLFWECAHPRALSYTKWVISQI